LIISCRIFVDAANPSFISTLKQAVNEDPDYTKQFQYYKHNYPSIYDLQFLQQNMFCDASTFSREYKNMLAHVKELLEYQNGMVAIHPRHNKLIISLRTAVENGEGSLDKEATSHDDLFDSFRLSLMFLH
jgi:conjugal transfer/entry exclusion protein